MKKLFFVLFSLLAIFHSNAQILDPVKWKTRTEKISDTEYNLIFEGTIDKGWHMYTQYTPDGGPLPTELIFENAKGNYELVGKAKESAFKKQFNEVFEVDEYFFENNVTLTQRVKILKPNVSKITMSLEYQVCKEVCINQQKNFTFSIAEGVENEVIVSDTTEVTQVTSDKKGANSILSEDKYLKQKSKRGLLSIFFLAFLGGLAALFTPCVFPMIPMTVSFFTKQSKTRAKGIKNAVFYAFSIIAIYVMLGSLVTALFGAEVLNELSTNVWFNLFFFLLLVVFAVSFLGAFEIMLPNSWANKVDRQADRGGIIGILFMALALAIISFSCTGPIVGTLLVEAATKGGLAPIIGMLGFSLALALPFMLFAMFPGWLNSMPKSGGWLNSVKVSLGFLELALALKFLSNADLVLQLHWLEREVFLAIWIVIFGVWALYLFGKITLPHDSPISHISVGRLSLGMIVLIFTVYLIPGLWGAPLKLISAFPPPLTYSESPYGFGGKTVSANTEQLPEGAEMGPHGLMVFNDYQTGLEYAKKVNKPVMLDFTGYACVNCRKMESNVWSEESVLKILKNDLVIISLYVDDKRKLPESEQVVSSTTGKKIITIGNKWTDFMISRYKTNTQPFYVLMNLDEQNLNDPISYTPDYKDYENWLKEGIAVFK